jgi:formylglycine-generating enzyme required for sulfatase activity
MKTARILVMLSIFLTAGFSQAKEPLKIDLNGDFVISHQEMLRVVEMWKSGAYRVDSNGNYVPGNGKKVFTVNLPKLSSELKPLDMVLIEAGTFVMGSPPNERYRMQDEQQHVVTITNPFYIGKCEVTQAQWLSMMDENPSSYKGRLNHPVQNVTWSNCQNFITRLNQTGQGTFRLPTEAEWEYACRAGTTTRFYWGDDPGESLINQYALYGGNNNYTGTREVGTLLPNSWGLHDMSGNVWEWCQDFYGPYPNPPSTGYSHVFRGGDRTYSIRYHRSAHRGRYDYEDKTGGHYGFRLCRNP